MLDQLQGCPPRFGFVGGSACILRLATSKKRLTRGLPLADPDARPTRVWPLGAAQWGQMGLASRAALTAKFPLA